VRGSLDRVSDGTAYFDSEEFDDLEIDWVDVAELRSSRMHTYRLQEAGGEDDTIVTGTVGMVDGVLRIGTDAGVVEFDRAVLVSMIAGGLKESDFWSGEVSLGITARKGNSDQADLSAYAEIKRETALTRGLVSYRGSWSTAEGSKTASNHRATGQFDYYLTRRLYLVSPAVEIFRDTFQNTALRASVGLGLGYDLLKRSWITWDAGGLAVFQQTQFDTAPAGDPTTASDAAMSLNTSVELDPTRRVEWDTTYKIAIVVTDLEKTNHNLTSVVSVEIWGPLDLDVTAVWDRISKPAEAADGTRPSSDDLRLTVGLAIDF